MLKKTPAIFLIVAAAIFCFIAKGFAQESISVEKKALVRELLQVAGSRQMAEDTINMMLSQMLPPLKENLKKTLLYISQSNKNLTEEEKAPVIQKANENIDKIMQRFAEEFPKRISWYDIEEEIYIPVYDKYFTEEEIRNLIVFYESPIGSKMRRLMPEIMKETIPKCNEIGVIKAKQLIDEICNDVLGPRPQAQSITQ